MTKMSQNGQVVIPKEIRKDAHLKPHSKFLVFNKGGNILLKLVDTEKLSKEMDLVEAVGKSEKQIKNGKVVKAKTSMSIDEIDKLLTL